MIGSIPTTATGSNFFDRKSTATGSNVYDRKSTTIGSIS
jgi:hypothetical protein